MADEAPSSSLPASSGSEVITILNDNDVVLGRGTGPNEVKGNRRYRALIEQRQEEYNSIGGLNKHAEKKLIVSEVITHIHNLGGRFVRRVAVETQQPADGTLPEEELWNEVEESVAVEKCRQALRDHRKKRRSSVGNGLRKNVEKESNESEGVMSSRASNPPTITSGILSCLGDVMAPSLLEGAIHVVPAPLPVFISNVMPVLPWTSFASSGADIGDARLSAFHHQAMVSPQGRNDVRVIPDAHALALQDTLPSRTCGIVPKYGLEAENVMGGRNEVVEFERGGSSDVATARPSMLEADISSAASQAELSEYLLSLLTWNRSMITEEQVELERAAMTNEERAAALSDLFGKQCAVDEHQSKRAKRDLDKNSIEFLVEMMRVEIGRIPEDRKQALLEAQTKCRADEFSDARLERFLRCEGMNSKLGAQRFVNYWESRREVFGPDKFKLRMTLNEALCDDLAAVEACCFRPLPHLDASGRQLIFLEPSRHTREGYTSESMLRAVWYVFEVVAQENTDRSSGVIVVNWVKDMTMWDYDKILYDSIVYFDKTCWPVKIIANHLCCPPWIVAKIIQPILNAVSDKRLRERKLEHNVPESQILDVLSHYGIMKDMLPTEMGGTIELNQAEWIASRRATELEEI